MVYFEITKTSKIIALFNLHKNCKIGEKVLYRAKIGLITLVQTY